MLQGGINMKKKMKKCLTGILCLLLVIGFVNQPLMAAEGQVRAIICPVCGNGTIITEKSYSGWVSKEVKCKHYVYGYDIVKEREVYTLMKCGMCEQEYDRSTTTQTKTECHGSATP